MGKNRKHLDRSLEAVKKSALTYKKFPLGAGVSPLSRWGRRVGLGMGRQQQKILGSNPAGGTIWGWGFNSRFWRSIQKKPGTNRPLLNFWKPSDISDPQHKRWKENLDPLSHSEFPNSYSRAPKIPITATEDIFGGHKESASHGGAQYWWQMGVWAVSVSLINVEVLRSPPSPESSQPDYVRNRSVS